MKVLGNNKHCYDNLSIIESIQMMINSSLCPALISVLLLNVSLGRTEMDKISQYHQSNNSKLEDSLVMTSKTNSYVPLSALCAESTLERIKFKLEYMSI